MNLKNYFLLNNLILDIKTNIWSKERINNFYYSDGDEQENYILELFRNTKDLSTDSVELSEKIHDWASLYYLSPQRSLLLKPFENDFRGKNILEIGCGCGTITRFLAECGANIVAVEGSKKRAEIARERCRNLKNVNIICGTTEDLKERAEFDFVLLIGVLEYAKKYLGENGDSILLEFCKLNLNKNGKLIIAIENKLGAKYISGAKEDHLFEPMVGINDSYEKEGVCTYGKYELLNKIDNLGLGFKQIFLPFPDYKFPSLVITPLGLKDFQNNLVRDLLLQVLHKDPQLLNTMYTCSLEGLMSNSCKNNMLDDVSNSFLLIASEKDFNFHGNIIAWYYSFFRKNKYCNSIVFGKDSKTFVKDLCQDKKIYIDENAYNYWNTIFSIINKKNWSVIGIYNWLEVWFLFLIKKINLSKIEFDEKVPGKYIDATPFNLIIGKNSYFIDYEFSQEKSIDLGYLYFRAIFNSLIRVSSFEYTNHISCKKVFDIVFKIMKIKFPSIDKKTVLSYLSNEVDFLNKSSILKVEEKTLLEKEINMRYVFDYRFNNAKFLFRRFLIVAINKLVKSFS
ncbi:bifunctional 2-polyprenyl-6-hydroxyphenol methylase/3-demethylubiquinol 3-O-methyltransferase UbiG [Acinetobacter sp. HR7]|uniref:class I SAM-dependent methyltransferase n=1 Tax=Acinetobacter sp. HR7 TaxID=1509403 RepID=UPI00053709DE|nr:class I SAM-dependent methyltransferase [Acinetobacter sp. HR7]KGT48279.1 hypothetical protein GW12_06800 [Acinetobacter sp. HR7]